MLLFTSITTALGHSEIILLGYMMITPKRVVIRYDIGKKPVFHVLECCYCQKITFLLS